MDRSDYFRDFPPPPETMTVSNTVARLVDGLGFRLYHSMVGLREEECNLMPCEKGKSIGQTIHHIWGLVNWVRMHIYGQQMNRPKPYIEQGWAALAELEHLRKHFVEISDEELARYTLEDMPWWNFVNMPLSDALHHEGEVRLLRMQIGNPVE
jgi:hypothetical protein